MMNDQFNEFAENSKLDLNPTDLKEEISKINDWIFKDINLAVYKCGYETTNPIQFSTTNAMHSFASQQEDYDKSFDAFFQAMDKLELMLQQTKFLTGSNLTLADVRLWTTLIRFDLVYYGT